MLRRYRFFSSTSEVTIALDSNEDCLRSTEVLIDSISYDDAGNQLELLINI
jgi:hypothetical protein